MRKRHDQAHRERRSCARTGLRRVTAEKSAGAKAAILWHERSRHPGRIPAGAMTGSWAPWPILATGMRLTDVRLLRVQQITDGCIDLSQSKTDNDQRWEITPAVRGILDEAAKLPGRAVSMYVFPTRRGTPLAPTAKSALSFLPAPLSSLVVPREVQVANVEPEESEPQPDGHAIVAEMVLAHVCSRCRKCLMASACAGHRLALGGSHRTARPPRQHRVCHSGRISHALSSRQQCSQRPAPAVS
jgi:hypothetical protein